MTIHDLSIGYGEPIAEAIDAELCPGQLICLTGRNGSGKSTLLRTLAGLQKPLAGAFSAEQCAIVLTRTPQLQHTTVRQLVAYGRLGTTGFFGRLREEDYAAADRAIRTLRIDSLAPRNFATLSDGERQKTMIARAIAQEAPLLLLDEPSAFLDYPSRRELMLLLQSLAHDHGKCILLSTHDVELATQSADLLWLLKERSLKTITPQDFRPEEL